MMKNLSIIRCYKFTLFLTCCLFFLLLRSAIAQDDNVAVDASATPASPLAIPAPLTSEQRVAPIPERFNWLRPGSLPNSLLESLLDFREGPTNFLLSFSLTGEYSDNFSRSNERINNGDRRGEGEEYRALLNIGTVYRAEEGRAFLSLANSFSTNYRFKAEETDIAFANLNFIAGYEFPRLSIALRESFIRDNDFTSDALRNDPSVGLSRQRNTFLRNTVGPQMRYRLSRLTAMNLGYTYILTLREDSESELTSSHTASIGLDQKLSRKLSMDATYAFTTTNGGQNMEAIRNDELNETTNRIHSPGLRFSYAINERTSLSLQGTARFSRREPPNRDATTYGGTLGINRALTSYLAAYVAVGPQVFEAEGEGRQIFPNWQLQLNGDLPFLRTRLTRVTLAARQSIDDTSTEVNDVGIALRQSVALTLSHTISRRLRASFFVDYARTEVLQDVETEESVDGRVDNLWNAGTQVSYTLTRTFFLSASYRHQQRLSNIADSDFANNIVTIVLSSSFPVF